MWIETVVSEADYAGTLNSFASNGECGLKPQRRGDAVERPEKFIRQQWRMWIETACISATLSREAAIHSPAMANVD